MTPKEIVLQGYQYFASGDMDNLSKLYAEDAVITIYGDHRLSGKYIGFHSFLTNVLAHLPSLFPNFDLEIIQVCAEEDNVFLHVKYKADNLDANAVHRFVVKDGKETEFHLIEDSQKMSTALGG